MKRHFAFDSRLEKLRGLLRKAGLDAAALVPGPNLIYLTGAHFHLMERPLLAFFPREGDPVLALGALELPKIERGAPFPIRCFPYTDAEGHLPAIEKACAGLAGLRIGVEGLRMRVLEGQLVQKYAPGCTIEDAEEWLMWLRMHKEADEIALMRQAVAASEAALDAVIAEVRPGMTERQIANMLLNALAEAGGGENAFEPIVLSGPNTALPHGTPSDRQVRAGDLLLFDFGTKIDGYASDITRTFVIGEPDPGLVEIYETVRAANAAATQAVRPGLPAQEVDRAARRIIEEAGYGEYFIHRTGHGLGLDVHEAPYIREGNAQALEPGMVFTIEPGIYVPEVGGVRIEDNVVVTEAGVEVLTSFDRNLRMIGR